MGRGRARRGGAASGDGRALSPDAARAPARPPSARRTARASRSTTRSSRTGRWVCGGRAGEGPGSGPGPGRAGVRVLAGPAAASPLLSSAPPQRLAGLLAVALERGLPGAGRGAWLQSVRILTRDPSCLRLFARARSLHALARHAGLAADADADADPAADPDPDPDPDPDAATLEALKCLCNLVLRSPAAQLLAAEAGLAAALLERVARAHAHAHAHGHDVQFFDLRLLFLLTALRPDVRRRLAEELRGVRVLTGALERTLAAAGGHDSSGPPERLPAPETERAMEVLKVLFNITLDSGKRDADEVRAGRGHPPTHPGWAPPDFCGQAEVAVLHRAQRVPDSGWGGRLHAGDLSCRSPGPWPTGHRSSSADSPKPEWGSPTEPLSLWAGGRRPFPAPGDPSAALCDDRVCRRPHRGVPRVKAGPVLAVKGQWSPGLGGARHHVFGEIQDLLPRV